MKVPLSWLKEFIALEADPAEIAAKLTAAGMKVEKVTRPGTDLERVVVAEVLAIKPHPNADKLILVQVRTDTSEREVVCGAKNFAVGDRVPLAVPGSVLPEFPSFEAKKIRGVLSDGMLCSARDMGLDEDHSGIYLLDPAAPLGADVKQVLGLDEVVFELEITPNRPDAMSIIGVAREVAACFGGEISLPSPNLSEDGDDVGSSVDVVVDDPEGCPRYLARVIKGVKVAPSPPEVQSRLIAAGVRPVCNVVDATNYVLLMTGHPLHAFDLDKLSGSKIIVRRARSGERLLTIDKVDRQLDADDLVIADAEHPVAIAGVMGGLGTEVADATVNVMLEAAYFDPKAVFRSSKRHSLRSEASARFERGADPEGVAIAADLAAEYISRWAGGEVAAGVIDVYPNPAGSKAVRLRPERARALLGMDVSDEEMIVALDRLGLAPTRDGDDVVVLPPTRRRDITIEEDLVEEIARVVGYDKLPLTLPSGSDRHGGIGPEERFVRNVRRVLAGAGSYEARTDSLVGPDLIKRMGYAPADPIGSPIAMANALTRDHCLLRTSLVPGLVDAALRNLARRRTEVRLFEIGTCFWPSKGQLPDEPLKIAMLLAGGAAPSWHSAQRPFDFFDLKGQVEALLEAFRVPVEFIEMSRPPLHPTRAAEVRSGDVVIGTIGELAPDALNRFDVEAPVVVAELDARLLMGAVGAVGGYQDTSRFPAVLLDIAVVVERKVSAGDVLTVASDAGGELLEEVRLFDVYQGDQLGDSKKSVALSLAFRSPDRTLTEAEAIVLRDVIAARLASELGGTIRS